MGIIQCYFALLNYSVCKIAQLKVLDFSVRLTVAECFSATPLVTIMDM